MIWSFESFSKSSFVYRVYSTHSLLSSHLFLDKFITHSHCQEAQKDIHRIHPPWGAMPWIPGDGSIVWMEFGSHKVGHQAASSCCGSSPVWYSPSRGHGTTNSLARAQIQLKQNTFHSKKETSLIQIFGQCLVCTVLGGKKKNSAPPRYRWIKKTHTHTHTWRTGVSSANTTRKFPNHCWSGFGPVEDVTSPETSQWTSAALKQKLLYSENTGLDHVRHVRPTSEPCSNKMEPLDCWFLKSPGTRGTSWKHLSEDLDFACLQQQVLLISQRIQATSSWKLRNVECSTWTNPNISQFYAVPKTQVTPTHRAW